MTPLLESHLPGRVARRGKVRDVYDLGDQLLLVATDRISAFDVVMPTGIPNKGRVLTALSAFWFTRLAGIAPHHLIRVLQSDMPADLSDSADQLRGRAMLCHKAAVIPVECVVRGYLAGSGWKEYQQSGRVCGIELPRGLRQCERLPAPIFTPATKAETGHDENVSFEQAAAIVGGDDMGILRDQSIRLYEEAARHARLCGVIIADTKFEFGRRDGSIIWIDEALTPDSSRFWPADKYAPGRDQESFDKQFVRNYLETLVARGEWNKCPPGPPLPESVTAATELLYQTAYQSLTGNPMLPA